MSTTKRPSAVSGLRRGVGAVGAEPAASESPSVPSVPSGGPPPRPEKPVRFTLDLDQERHAFLKGFALECGAGTGGAAVLRTLLDELQEGPNLAARVKARIWAAQQRYEEITASSRTRSPRGT